jgi:N-acetylglucosaminyldiphosphoundecaprenol N-acetyl-beta-D-mannosaminyltransferase
MLNSSQSNEEKARSRPPAIQILGVPVHGITQSEVLPFVSQLMDEPKLHQIATVNPEFVMLAQEDIEFRQVLHQADLCIPDGVGLILASRWQGTELPERVAGSDMVYTLAEMAANEGWRLYLLGASPGVAEEAASLLCKKYPKLIIAGTYAGTPSLADNDAIVKRVNESRADLLYVAYGAPRQDKWIARNRVALKSVRLAMGVGGSLDFITGRSVRAPSWLQRLGLEWLHRLYKEPWRWRRMMALPRFTYLVLRQPNSFRK